MRITKKSRIIVCCQAIKLRNLFLMLFLISISLPPIAQATLFDAPDFLEEGKLSAGIVGEILVSNPSSEGAEARLKYGVSKNLSSQAIIGTGSNYRKFRLGIQNTLSVFPDVEGGQIGVAVLLNAMYLRRQNRGTFNTAAGPMIHKKIPTQLAPMNFFFAFPLSIELDHGRYYTGSQLVVGVVGEFSRVHVPIEFGIGLGYMESYVSGGIGFHF